MEYQIKFTTIDHVARERLGLTQNEYSIADSIYQLANNPGNKYPGWCNATKEYMAEFIGINERTVRRIIEKLIDKGLAEKEIKYGLKVKTTQKWYDAVVARKIRIMNKGNESLTDNMSDNGRTKLHSNKGGKRTDSPLITDKTVHSLYNNNNNILYNDKDKDNSSSVNKKFLKKKSNKGMRLGEGIEDLLQMQNAKYKVQNGKLGRK